MTSPFRTGGGRGSVLYHLLDMSTLKAVEVRSCGSEMKRASRVAMPLVNNRAEYVLHIAARGTRVAHIGAADSPYTRERLQGGTLLHSRLLALPDTDVVGLDVDVEGLALLRASFPAAQFDNVDVSSNIPILHQGRYDCVIAGEVLEHVGNAEQFLLGCTTLLSPRGVLCVTVPNACSPKIGLRALGGTEVVHPDHRVYYSPRTLQRTLDSADLEIVELLSYLAEPSRLGRLVNPILRAVHSIREGPIGEGLIAVARSRTGPHSPAGQ